MGKTDHKLYLVAVALVAIFIIHITIYVAIPTKPVPTFRSASTVNPVTLAPPLLNVSILTTETAPIPKHRTFLEIMRHFPWDPFNRAVQAKDSIPSQDYATNLTWKLYPFLLRTPPIPVNPSCRPPTLDISAAGRTCDKLPIPRKVGVLLTFSFEVDALEIHFHELDAVVDKFFLLESESAHHSHVKSKPLIWQMLKKDPRFSRFVPKTVNFILTSAAIDSDIGAMEKLERRILWERFQRWNNRTQYFNDEDVLGFGDVDEIPDRNNVAFLKYCQLPSDPIDIGIWFPVHGMDTVFQTECPVSRHPYSYGNPTYWTLGRAKSFAKIPRQVPTRRFGTSDSYLLGGMHLSRYYYPPYAMIKYLTCAECDWTYTSRVSESGLLYRNGSIQAASERMNRMEPSWVSRTVNLTEFQRNFSDEARMIVKVPWFLQCNLDRYPVLKNKWAWDPRLNYKLATQ